MEEEDEDDEDDEEDQEEEEEQLVREMARNGSGIGVSSAALQARCRHDCCDSGGIAARPRTCRRCGPPPPAASSAVASSFCHSPRRFHPVVFSLPVHEKCSGCCCRKRDVSTESPFVAVSCCGRYVGGLTSEGAREPAGAVVTPLLLVGSRCTLAAPLEGVVHLGVLSPTGHQAATSAASGSGDPQFNPNVIVIVVILCVVFILSGLLHLLAWCLGRRRLPPRNHSPIASALYGQLQQLFHLHDAGVEQAFIDTLPVFS
nr:uncharacterized protein LOC112275729 [Physcomitrium patens]|eukprot:XP_024362108.1 uncharacterized protein LOC112275729 [Physcomitrella patens]